MQPAMQASNDAHLNTFSRLDHDTDKWSMHLSIRSTTRHASGLDDVRAEVGMAATDRAEQRQPNHGQGTANSARGELIQFGAQFDSGEVPHPDTSARTQPMAIAPPAKAWVVGMASQVAVDGDIEQGSSYKVYEALSGISHLQLANDEGPWSSKGIK